MKQASFFYGVFSALFLLLGCASPPAPKSVSLQDETSLKAGEIEPRARPAFGEAERAYRAKKYAAAVDEYQAIKKKFPGGHAAQVASYRVGSIFYLQSKYSAASQEFQNFLSLYPKSDLVFDATYNYAASEFQLAHPDKAYEAIRRFAPEWVRSQGPKRAEVFFQLGAQAAAAIRNHSGALFYAAASLQLPIGENKRRILDNGITSQLNQIQSTDELSTLLSRISEPATRARIAERIGLLSGGGAPLPGSVPNVGLTGAGAGDRAHLGVVLPLSGPLAGYGKKALDGILLAAGTFQATGGTDFEVFVEDTASNPALAAQAVERLVEEHNVIGIIGPISWKESLATADRAQELGVLNLSLAGKEGITERGSYLFQNALTPRVQMENLVKHCIEEKHFRRFAILAPDNKFGEDMSNEFLAVATRLGGRIVAYETYAPGAKDFQAPAQALAGLGELRFRKMENAKLDAFIKEQQVKTRRPSKARLPAYIDFDAVFLPDGPKAAAQIAASLAYFDVTGVTLLGTSEWNTDQLHKRGGRLMEGAIFPGGLLFTSNNPRQKDFIRQYADAYGMMPDLLAAQAYEAVELVFRAASASGGNRNSAVSELMSLSRFESPLGQLSFDSNRIALRVLPILTMEPGGNIVEQ